MADYSNAATAQGEGADSAVVNARAEPRQFIIPELCNATALSLLVLFGELLVVVLIFAGGNLSWVRFGLMSLFVQWVTLTSAGALCALRGRLAVFGLVTGAFLAFCLVITVTLLVGLAAQEVVSGAFTGGVFDGGLLRDQLVISGIITAMALRYFYVQQQLRAQEQSELEARIQALQSRIRPHFLFNSMNIIASLIASDPDTAETVVEDLAELFRASLNDAGNQVRLSEELDLCERYVRIEALRLGDRLQLHWDVAATPESVKIPLLTLQPLLENAIYHGIQPRPEGGTISVRVWLDDSIVNVEIMNPLPPANARSLSEGNKMALNNIRSRLAVLYGSRAELSTITQDDRFVTTLRYPGLGEVFA